ncbi:MAG: hypothetical protein IKD59_09210 [Lachnospiraceae bacterium]|nr:hypothetical protein [Lachnospiraceae bacterium]MBR3374218.1 hypothetical protein [Bacillota bacterium]
MFDKFGEMGSVREINDLAANLLKEADTESIRILAKENGLEPEIADMYISGEITELCDDTMAAIGKIEVEADELKPTEIMQDWIEYVKSQCMESEEMARAVRSKGKTIKGMIGELLKWSFQNQYNIDKFIMKAAGVNANKCTLGIPGMGTAKKIIKEYYTGGAS